MSENNVEEKKEIISYHTFMFPFSFEKDFNFEEIEKTLKKETNWKREFFNKEKSKYKERNYEGELEEVSNYNEWKYFYHPVQKLLYDVTDKKNTLNMNFSYDFNEDVKYKIKVLEEKEYELELEEVSLKIFKNGVGILNFHCENNTYDSLDDIKKINDFGRRTYVQMFPVEKAKRLFLPNKISIESNEKVIVQEDFEDFKSSELKISKTVTFFLHENLINNHKIMPLIDDRMFTLCWFANTPLSVEIKRYDNKSEEYNYFSNEKWAEYLFVDGIENTCKSRRLLREKLGKHTYDRWVDYGTLYGISRYSFVALVPEKSPMYLLTHMKTIYFRLILITLFQRATVLKFKNRITSVVVSKNKEEIKKIQEDYLEFLNSMNFREITAQEQGIEIYNMIRDIMEINEAVRELEQEISELHNYHAMIESELRKEKEKQQEKRQKEKDDRFQQKLNIITILGGAISITGVIIAILGMTVFESVLESNNQWELYFKGIAFIILPFSIMTSILFRLLYKVNEEEVLKQEKLSLIFINILIFIIYSIIVA